MDGYLLVDKPAGISSFGVVARVRGIIKSETGQKIKIGHTGTLDPAATGLMILVLGKYTKRAGEFSKMDKTYEAELTLGKTSMTGDSEGIISKKQNVKSKKPTQEDIQEVLGTFLGEISQTPPIYSAIKVDGRRAYDMARKGQEVRLQPRQVKIYEITDIKYDYPKLSFTVSVSSGTYIRSLAEDIGAKLGSGAYLSALKRTKVDNYRIVEAASLDDLVFADFAQHLRTGVVK